VKHTEEDLAYAAGFLDGEGCFKFTNGTPEVCIENTYVYTLVWFTEMFGGTCRVKTKPENPKWRQAYAWAATGDNARNCINAVLPYLQEKLPQAKILLEISAYPPRSHQRAQLNQELRKLKRINYEWNHSNSSQQPSCSLNFIDASMIQFSLLPQK
tara:strand:- start:729 stop:1196 length:468 start_codon:yes stop_codon:yes gene_type:complete